MDIEDPDEVFFWTRGGGGHVFDFKADLTQFFQLRNVRKVCIHCLPGLVPGNIVLENAVRVMEQAEYVLPKNSGSLWDFTHDRKDLEHIQFLLEDTLDLVPNLLPTSCEYKRSLNDLIRNRSHWSAVILVGGLSTNLRGYDIARELRINQNR